MNAAPLYPGLLEPEELFRHVCVFGATGSGKTRMVILPLLQQVLARNAGDPGQRAGALIFDVKGDMARHVQDVMRAAGRTDEIITIGRGGNAWFDPFAGLEADSRAVTERLMEIVRSMHSGGGSLNEDFWIENLRRFLQASVVVAKAFGLGDLHGISGIAKATSAIIGVRSGGGGGGGCGDDDDADGDFACLESGRQDACIMALDRAAQWNLLPPAQIAMAREYLLTEARDLNPRTWSTITNYAQAYISCLQDSGLAKIISPGNGAQFFPDEVIDHGRVVLVSLSRIHFGPGAEVYRTLIKTAFQQAALQRHSRTHFDGTTVRPVNATRPVLFVADEFPSMLTVGGADDGDAFFLDKCREVKIACILSAQGVSGLGARMNNPFRVNHLLNNCCCKVFMASDCPETLSYFSITVPGDDGARYEEMEVPVPAPPAFRLPNYEFAAPRRWKPEHRSKSGGPKPKFPSSILRQLETGEAIVIRPRGFAERMKFPPFIAGNAGDRIEKPAP